jgi:hypothetical protein
VRVRSFANRPGVRRLRALPPSLPPLLSHHNYFTATAALRQELPSSLLAASLLQGGFAALLLC